MRERKVKARGAELAAQLRKGDRRTLARAITLVESTRLEDRSEAEALLTELLPQTGRAIRIGISGAPGAGKSTFIEAFGTYLTEQGQRVAVLAVDPSSQRSGGSILGDKTRMEQLARNPRAFIRPSPSGMTLGGVARRTREALLLVEAADFDVVLVETVGVGQSETAVAGMVDLFVLLVSPGGGDDLQGIKRGVMELADLVLVTKADGDLMAAANRAASDYQAALHLMRPKYPGVPPQVAKVSALKGEGIAEAWTIAAAYHAQLVRDGHLRRLREEQARRWFWSEVEAVLMETIGSDPRAAEAAQGLEAAVVAGRALPHAAARSLIADFRRA
ncbi:MAG TPA: methylmalonyl Co-A mutase-associated GTPase MeaB [Rhizomicrobium sp.]|nr:methylmalonyl Co-A mutase-associated GTPase MeaB [Rhizomicrobium sp.]